jgi:uncharacterized damage-inducible protein DinB
MSRVKELARHLDRTVRGPVWHGPSLTEVLNGVTAEQALAHRLSSAHSIWEIVLHVTAWAEIARARLKGERIGDPAPDQDWPPVAATGADDWEHALHQLRASHRQLAEDVGLLDESQLDEKITGLPYSTLVLLHGVVEHGAYHGGQIALLKKA